MDRQNSSRTHGNLRPSYWQRLHRRTLRSAELCKLADTCPQVSKHAHKCRHTHTHTHNQQVLRIFSFFLFFLPLLGRAGLYPAWLDQWGKSLSMVSCPALLPVNKELFDYFNNHVNSLRCHNKVGDLFKLWSLQMAKWLRKIQHRLNVGTAHSALSKQS